MKINGQVRDYTDTHAAAAAALPCPTLYPFECVDLVFHLRVCAHFLSSLARSDYLLSSLLLLPGKKIVGKRVTET